MLGAEASSNLTFTIPTAKLDDDAGMEVVCGCSKIEDILRLRESGDAGLGLKEKRISAGAESDLRCQGFGFEGDAGKWLKLSNEPDFL